MEEESVTNLTADDVELLKESRERLFHEYIQANPLPLPPSNEDIPLVRLINVEEKVESLKKEADEFCADFAGGGGSNSAGNTSGSKYERLVETCVKLQIQLDSVNVREDLRLRKRQLLVQINSITSNLDRIFQNKSS